MKNLTSFKFEPTTPNKSQHLQYITTGWPNARNMLRPTMLAGTFMGMPLSASTSWA